MIDHREVRIAVVGVGAMGSVHAEALRSGRIPRARLVAVCDPLPAARARFSDVAGFSDSSELVASGLADAVLIATPHYDHAPLAVHALGAGLHVLTEKPIAVHKADAERMRSAYEQRPNAAQVFAAMFSLRIDPRFLALRELLAEGRLGSVRRVSWVITDWFRTEAYYRSQSWRGTWQGEGGGVLVNQCPHYLDLWQWLFGMPARVHAFCGFGRFHEIEVEDQVTAYLEYEGGKSGVLVTSTGEAPGANRLEVAGDLGRVVLDGERFRLSRNEVSAADYAKSERSGRPQAAESAFRVTAGTDLRNRVLENFVAAILDGDALIAPAVEGIASVELANAMISSARSGQTLTLPLDSAAYAAELAQLVAASGKHLLLP